MKTLKKLRNTVLGTALFLNDHMWLNVDSYAKTKDVSTLVHLHNWGKNNKSSLFTPRQITDLCQMDVLMKLLMAKSNEKNVIDPEDI